MQEHFLFNKLNKDLLFFQMKCNHIDLQLHALLIKLSLQFCCRFDVGPRIDSSRIRPDFVMQESSNALDNFRADFTMFSSHCKKEVIEIIRKGKK